MTLIIKKSDKKIRIIRRYDNYDVNFTGKIPCPIYQGGLKNI